MIIVPGAFALAPWFVWLSIATNGTTSVFVTDHAIAAAWISGAIVLMGLVLENLGSMVESQVFDRILERLTGNHYEYWRRYLLLSFKIEPIGQHYLRTRVLRLKFELGMISAIPIALFGWLALNSRHQVPGVHPCWLTLGATAALIWFIVEAYANSRGLSKLRKDLVDQYSRD